MTQFDVFGGETPLEELELGPVAQLLAARERELGGRLSADEAGAIIHARRGKHAEDVRCEWCSADGFDALARLGARLQRLRG